MKYTKIIILIAIVIFFGLSFYLYPLMPDKMASHWGVNGEVNGWSSRAVALFLLPIISLIMFLVFLTIPKIDPLRENIKKFRNTFDGFIILIFLFFFYIYGLTIFWSLGFRFNIGQFMIPAFAVLFYYCGILISKAKRNWFIGIRTPWTLSNDLVWDKTHKVGAILFKAIAVISLAGIFFPVAGFFFIIFSALAAAIFVIIYSYCVFKKSPK